MPINYFAIKYLQRDHKKMLWYELGRDYLEFPFRVPLNHPLQFNLRNYNFDGISWKLFYIDCVKMPYFMSRSVIWIQSTP